MADENREAPDRRTRILEGARCAFLRFGFKRTSLADIAETAGVSRTALYHYFSSKEDVLRAVVDDLHTSTLQHAAQALREATTLEEALTGLFEAKLGQPSMRVCAASSAGPVPDDSTLLIFYVKRGSRSTGGPDRCLMMHKPGIAASHGPKATNPLRPWCSLTTRSRSKPRRRRFGRSW